MCTPFNDLMSFMNHISEMDVLISSLHVFHTPRMRLSATETGTVLLFFSTDIVYSSTAKYL